MFSLIYYVYLYVMVFQITKKSLKFAYLIAVTGFTIYALLCG